MRARALALAGTVAALALLLAPAGEAATSFTGPGQFSISPARRIVFARPPASLAPTIVSNSTQTPLRVRVFAVLLRQHLPGPFTFLERAPELRQARQVVEIDPARFLLEPGRQRAVSLRWSTLPRSWRAAYIGVVFQGTPAGHSAGPVTVVDRLLSLNFLQPPGHYKSGGTLTALNPRQGGPQQLDLVARVKNTGQGVGAPAAGRVSVIDASGRTVYRGSWIGDIVIPGAQRDVTIGLDTNLPAGSYRAIASMSFAGARRARLKTRFRLSGMNQLAAPRVELRGFQAIGTIGAQAEISGQLRSVGSETASTTLTLALLSTSSAASEQKPLATRTISVAGLRPGSAHSFRVRLGHLRRGSYRVIATYTNAPGSQVNLTNDFVAAPPRSSGLGFLHVNVLLLALIVAVLVLVCASVALLHRQRLLRAELDALRGDRTVA